MLRADTVYVTAGVWSPRTARPARKENQPMGLGVPLALGGIAAISAGVAAAHRLPERHLRVAFCGPLTATAGLLALHG